MPDSKMFTERLDCRVEHIREEILVGAPAGSDEDARKEKIKAAILDMTEKAKQMNFVPGKLEIKNRDIKTKLITDIRVKCYDKTSNNQ